MRTELSFSFHVSIADSFGIHAQTLSQLVRDESMHKILYQLSTTSITNQTTLNGNKMEKKENENKLQEWKSFLFYPS